MNNKIKLFVVDDSAIVRNAFTTIVEKESRIELVGIASNPLFAQKKIEKLGFLPDVMILDLEMPQMDGITYLKKIMTTNPFPVIICTGFADKGSSKAIEALSAGAIEIIEKPTLGVNKFFEQSKMKILSSIFTVSKVKTINNFKKNKSETKEINTINHKTNDFLPKLNRSNHQRTQKIIAIGSSTGGVQILEEIISKLNPNSPPILIVQHMPKAFTKSLADRLNRSSLLSIYEAKNGDTLERGKILIAPGDKHMMLKRINKNYIVEIADGPKICHHRPSVDVLFRSFVNEAGNNGVGFILTGMGNDGAYGLKEMRDVGALTVSQNEDSCAVFGMPKEAIALGAAQEIMTPNEISSLINKL